MGRNAEFDAGSYHGSHRPDVTGPGLHEAEQAYPDVHEHPEYYSSGEKHEREALGAMNAARGKPDKPVTMYRAAPAGITHINNGDWVTPSRSYAAYHAQSQGGMVVHSAKTTASNLRATGDYLPEFGYSGENVPVKPKANPRVSPPRGG